MKGYGQGEIAEGGAALNWHSYGAREYDPSYTSESKHSEKYKRGKENYKFMIWAYIIFIASPSGIFTSTVQKEYIEHFQVVSPVLTEIVETTVDSCQSRIG